MAATSLCSGYLMGASRPKCLLRGRVSLAVTPSESFIIAVFTCARGGRGGKTAAGLADLLLSLEAERLSGVVYK